MSYKGFRKLCKKGGDVNWGLLHDTMSLELRKFKDSGDELQYEMDKNQAALLALRNGLNAQMEVDQTSGDLHEDVTDLITLFWRPPSRP